HVGVGQVYLLMLGLVEAGDLEESSFVFVENRGEDAWRVELRQTAPVDRTVHTHQRDRMEVADDAVGLDRLVGHSSPPLLRKQGRHQSRHSDRKSQFQPSSDSPCGWGRLASNYLSTGRPLVQLDQSRWPDLTVTQSAGARASTRARHDIASCTCCPAQVGARSS